MKIAEALVRRADVQKRMDQIKNLLLVNSRHQEGDDPPIRMNDTLQEWGALQEELLTLTVQINLANARVKIGEQTLMEVIAARDSFRRGAEILRELAKKAMTKLDRYSSKEIREVSPWNVQELLQRADEAGAIFRKMDVIIQQTNWNTDL